MAYVVNRRNNGENIDRDPVMENEEGGPEIWTTPRDWLRITMIGDILEGRGEWNAGQGWQGTRARSLLGKSVSRIVLLFHDWCEFRGTGFTLLTDINSFRRLKIAKPVPFDRWKLSNPVAETLKRRIFIRERERVSNRIDRVWIISH